MPETITTISPLTGEAILTRAGISEADFPALLNTSTTAFATYRKIPLAERQQIITRFLDLLTTATPKLAQEITEQMGRPIRWTASEVSTAIARSRYLLSQSSSALTPISGEAQEGFKRYITREPLGPILVVTAWNYPYLILVNSVIPALLAGNTLLLKPSPQTPTVAEHFRDLLQDAGLPTGVVQVVHCGNIPALQQLIQQPQVKAVAFTGSVAGGLAVQAAAAGRTIPVTLELGGKDPAYVRSDVDVKWAAAEVVEGAVFNSGQSCCAVERVYVHESIYEAFLEAAKEAVESWKMGDPREQDTWLGPVVSRRAADTVKAHVADAVSKGARNITPAVFPADLGPCFVRPELLADCTHEMTVMKDETFGPVIPVMKVSSDEEAIGLMNDSEFGLTASVWTKDVARGEELLAEVESGTGFVNRCDYPAPDLAWTGWKDSGRGATLGGGGIAFNGFVKLRSWHMKDYPVKA